MEPFRVICADPPWLFSDALGTRGAANNYRVMTTYDICQYRLPPVARDAMLFLWRVSSQQREALDVAEAWGFTVKTELVWLKKTVTGKRWFGMGRTLRAEHETCLIATRGNPLITSHSIRSTFVTDLDVTGFSARVGRHSEKPEEFYQIVEQLTHGPYCELFARRERAGWTCIGDELESHGQLTTVGI